MELLAIEDDHQDDAMEIADGGRALIAVNQLVDQMAMIHFEPNMPLQQAIPMLEQIQAYAGNVFDIVNAEFAGNPVEFNIGNIVNDEFGEELYLTVPNMVSAVKRFTEL